MSGGLQLQRQVIPPPSYSRPVRDKEKCLEGWEDALRNGSVPKAAHERLNSLKGNSIFCSAVSSVGVSYAGKYMT